MLRFLAMVLFLLAPALYAAAPIEDVVFASEEQEASYNELIQVLRCPKCLNVNLAGSDAPIAAQMRQEIREQLAQGRSEDEIKAFFVARYGDFVLYRPPLRPDTAVLWFGPLALLIAGFVILRRMIVASRATKAEELSPDELRKLQTLLDDKDAR